MGSSISPHGRTFRNYLGHIKKGRMVAGTTLDRYTPAVRMASGGLRNAKRGQFNFPNFLLRKDIVTTISSLGLGRMFSQLISIAFLFPLETIRSFTTQEGFHRGPIAEFITQNDKAPIGPRPFGRTDALVTKLSWSGDLDGVCILRRPFLCQTGPKLGDRIFPPLIGFGH